MKKDDRDNIRRERFIMISTSALVLTALTVTGVYMRSHNQKSQDKGYSIDFSALENRADDKIKEIADHSGKTRSEQNVQEDLGISGLEVGTGEIIIPGVTDGSVKGQNEGTAGTGKESGNTSAIGGKTGTSASRGNEKNESGKNAAQTSVTGNKGTGSDKAKNDVTGANKNVDQSASQGMSQGAEQGALANAENDPSESITDIEVLPYVETAGGSPIVADELHFSADAMQKPVSGEVLIAYSMDHSVYFATLDQYKYNPAVIYSAAQGETVTACTTGRVINVHDDAELGHVLVLDLGDGYQAIYGQVENIAIPIGATVEAGMAIATVAAPTKYYSKDGSNLYFQLKKDGVSIDPGEYF